MIVFVGVHPTPVTFPNPLDFDTRRLMIQERFPSVIVLPIVDHPSDAVWSANLDAQIRNVCAHGAVTLYAGRDGFSSHYTGKFWIHYIGETPHVSATMNRMAVAHTVVGSEDFRRGCIYASQNMYPRVQPTVDIALTRRIAESDGFQVVLGRKPGRDHWCFPGGFIDKSDETAQAAAERELQEETGLVGVLWKCLGGYKIRDWRDTASTSVMTTFFLANHVHGAPQAADDLEEVAWHVVGPNLRDIVDSHHWGLVDVLLTELLSKG